MQVRCKVCGNIKDGFKLEHYNLRICNDCFPKFFEKRVEETIKKFKMFTKKDSVVVAISGGKYSLSVTKALKNLGYNIRAFHLNARLGPISDKSQEVVEEFCRKEGIPLEIRYLEEEFEVSIKELSRISGRPICAVCGMVRRYVLNKFAKGEVIVTGHTLNDEVAFILKNLLFWNDEQLSRNYPVLEEREGLSKKVKPLCLITEEETSIYCRLQGIRVVEEPCPNKPEVYEVFKKTVENFNEKFPGSILGFYKGFLERRGKFALQETEAPEIHQCKICGSPTTGDICSICRLKEKLREFRGKG